MAPRYRIYGLLACMLISIIAASLGFTQENVEYGNGNLRGAEEYFERAYRLSGEDEEIRSNPESIRARLRAEDERQSETVATEEPMLTAAQQPSPNAVKKVKILTDPLYPAIVDPVTVQPHQHREILQILRLPTSSQGTNWLNGLASWVSKGYHFILCRNS